MSGVTALEQDVLRAIVEPYLGSQMDAQAVYDLQQQITLAYIDAGYFTSGAVVEPQDVGDGVLELTAVEGRLGEIRISGLEGRRVGMPRASYVERAFADLRGQPLRAADLEGAFRAATQDPSFDSVTGQVEPGSELGLAVLNLEVDPAPPFFLNATLDNSRSPATGAERVSLAGGLRNLVGYGEVVSFELGATEGASDALLRLSSPLPWAGLTVSVVGATSESSVIEEPFSELDLLSDTTTYGAGLSFIAADAGRNTLVLGAEVSRVEAQSKVFGLNISVSPGAQAGRTEYTALSLSQTLTHRGEHQSLVARSTFKLGLDAITPDFVNAFTPPDDFVSWRGQLQHARRLSDGGRLLLSRFELQVATEPAFAPEKFALGGPASVRGYRTNSIVADAGMLAGIELQLPLTGAGDDQNTEGTGGFAPGKTRLIAFAETGLAWNAWQEVDEGTDLSGVGVGLGWSMGDRVDARVDVATGLSGRPRDLDKTLQDYGVSFQLVARLF